MLPLALLTLSLAALCIWADAEFLALALVTGFAVFALS